MTLRFYDTQTAQIRDFEPITDGEVKMYYCGATVQGMPHVGHVRSAIVFDILVRWLEYRGNKVTVVRNVTDIDDKILEKSALSFEGPVDYPYVEDEEWFALAYRFEQEFQKAYDVLGVRRPTYEPRATGHIGEMHRMIQDLIDKGHAYAATDGSNDVYFDVRSWPDYGNLTRQKIDDMQAAPDADPRGKKDPRDFALWKGHKEADPITASWESPWGRGRPGWHIECSAMATKYLGAQFDIHGGGLDLRFPHHENELAQATAAGHGFANFWLHNGMVTFEGEKMSKSIGNTISPEEMIEKSNPRVARYFLGQAQYRSMLDYRPSSLDEAAAAIERIDTFVNNALFAVHGVKPGADFDLDLHHFEVPESFANAMDDDLNVPQALAALHETVRKGNSALASGDLETADIALQRTMAMTQTLGLDDALDSTAGSPEADALDKLISVQLEERAKARADKNWARADEIRDQLAAAGIIIEDSANGARWSISG